MSCGLTYIPIQPMPYQSRNEGITMQSLSLHQNSGYQPAAMINRNQPVSVDKHDQIRMPFVRGRV